MFKAITSISLSSLLLGSVSLLSFLMFIHEQVYLFQLHYFYMDKKKKNNLPFEFETNILCQLGVWVVLIV